MRRSLLLALLAACGPSAPAPVPTKIAPAEPPPPPAAGPAEPKKSTRPPEPPLTQAEIDLIDADPATLTPERRRDRAYALRRKIMQNPDSPTARHLEEIRLAVESGELKPQLPRRSPGLTLSAPETRAESRAEVKTP